MTVVGGACVTSDERRGAAQPPRAHQLGVAFWCRFVCGVYACRQEAGETYVQCATIYAEKLKEAHDSGVQYENAAKAFKNVNTKEALRCYNQAVDILVSSHDDEQTDARARAGCNESCCRAPRQA